MSANPTLGARTKSIEKAFPLAPDPVLTPAEVAGLATLPNEQIKVQGIVTRVVASPKYNAAYGDISYGERVIGFSLPLQEMPAKDSPIVIAGTLSLRHDTWSNGAYRYALQIKGRVMGEFEPYVAKEQIELNKPGARVPLLRMFSMGGSDPIRGLILCSDTAERDIKASLSGVTLNEVHLAFEQVRFHPASVAATMIRSAFDRYAPDFVVVARGGGAAEEIAVFANSAQVVKTLLDLQVPYYSAVGHAHDVTLVDKYSDESFHTPSGAGVAIRDAQEAKTREKNSYYAQLSLADQVKELAEQLIQSKRDIKATKRRWLWVSVLAASAGGAVASALLL